MPSFLLEYYKCCNNVKFHEQNMQALHMNDRHSSLEKVRLELLSRITETRCAWRTIPMFEKYRKQFLQVRARYPFFVMEGKTQTAKSSWAKDIFGDPSLVHYVNAACCDEPDLRKFDFFKHRAIVYDEANPKMIIRQKILFQSTTDYVKLGQSTTNCYSYDTFVSGIMHIICSNTWTAELKKLQQDDYDWLVDNSYHYNTWYTPLYECDVWDVFMWANEAILQCVPFCLLTRELA